MQQEQPETSERHTGHIKEIAITVGVIILAIGILILLCYLMYAFDLEPLKRSALGMPLFFDPDGLSLYERVCALFGWV